MMCARPPRARAGASTGSGPVRLDHIGGVDEDTVVSLVVGDRERLPLRRRRRRGIVRVALAPIRLQYGEGGGELPAEDPKQTLLARAEVALPLALEVEHPGQPAAGKQRNGRATPHALEAQQLDLDRGRLGAASTDAVLHGRVHRATARKARDAYDP